jgi:chromosome segregation ATPase
MRLSIPFCALPFRALVLAVLLGGVSFVGLAQEQPGDVAAAARKSREEQKTAPKPKKVLTNDDIPASTNAPAGADSSAKPGDAKADASDGKGKADTKEESNSEAAWRKRFQTLHDKLSTSEKELDVMQRELEKDQVQYYSDPQKALLQQYDRADINLKTTKIDEKKKEIDGLKQQISDLEDQLRQAGGDPGWAR